MNRNQSKELLPFIKAFSEGRIIEQRCAESWIEVGDNCDFHFSANSYRIKSESKYRPFKDAEECWVEMQKHQPFGWVKGKEGWHHSLITSIIADEEEVYINGISGFVLDDIMEHYTFSDGTPFGVKVED